tara:strand:- start:98 stop:1024 length:927 start_codon:yes stop_codon:yes gene_type:complete
METIVAIILVFIMILFDTRSVDRFINIAKPTNNNTKYKSKPLSTELFNTRRSSLSPKAVVSKLIKSNLWIYTNNEESSLIKLCIKSIIKHSSDLYNIIIISDNDIDRLIPEYKPHIQMCQSNYLRENIIKFGILFKYGGLWVPKDTLLLKPINSINDVYSCNLKTYGINNRNYNDTGISEQIISSKKNDSLVKSILQFLIKNTRGFQNAIEFKSSVNKRFNQFIKNNSGHTNINLGLTEKCSGAHYHISDLFTTNLVKFKNYSSKSYIKLYIDDLENLREYNYILSLSETEILNSNLFLALLVNKSLL